MIYSVADVALYFIIYYHYYLLLYYIYYHYYLSLYIVQFEIKSLEHFLKGIWPSLLSRYLFLHLLSCFRLAFMVQPGTTCNVSMDLCLVLWVWVWACA